VLDKGGGEKCTHHPPRWPVSSPQYAGADMGDATMSFPEIPADPDKGVVPGQDLTDVSTVEYGLVYQAEKPELIRYLLHCGVNYETAEDIAQRALEALYRKWATVGKPRPWLRTVAMRMLSRSDTPSECSLEGHDPPSAAPDAAILIESIFESDAVLAAIRQLPLKEKQVFALHFDEFGTSEIAEILQMTPAAVRQNLARGRAKLKQLLGLEGKLND
jgi:RNA polymerase sigma factor (sigma-70 family)